MIPLKIILLIPKLATPHDGELVATRDAVARLLLAAGLDWHDLARAASSNAPAAAAAPQQRPASSAFGDLARAARDLDRGQLSQKERAFVGDMVRRGFAFRPSPRQADWLAAILSRLEGRVAA